VWHLTWANAWIGSAAALLPGPFIYGPVGGGVSMDWRFVSVLGVRGTIFEIGRSLIRGIGRYANPLARIAWRRAQLILVLNRDAQEWLPRRHRSKTVVFPHAVLDRPPRPDHPSSASKENLALFAGRLIPWKGGVLVLRAMSLLPEWRLVICGAGSDERRLRRLAERFGLQERVTFLGMVSRDEVASWMRRADVFLFPSLHDDAPFAVAEALAEGLPVVCLDHGGAAAIAGGGVSAGSVSDAVAGLARAVRESIRRPIPAFPDIDSRTRRLAELLGREFPSWGLPPPEVESRVSHAEDRVGAPRMRGHRRAGA
jgi:glycosyltransferase involved in cell wall biosynthesis